MERWPAPLPLDQTMMGLYYPAMLPVSRLHVSPMIWFGSVDTDLFEACHIVGLSVHFLTRCTRAFSSVLGTEAA